METDDVRCVVIRETEKAWYLQDKDNEDRCDYFPKSQVTFKRRNAITGEAVAEIPLWLLENKGWNK